MILSAIAERLKRQSKDDFKGRHFETPLILQAVCLTSARTETCRGSLHQRPFFLGSVVPITFGLVAGGVLLRKYSSAGGSIDDDHHQAAATRQFGGGAQSESCFRRKNSALRRGGTRPQIRYVGVRWL